MEIRCCKERNYAHVYFVPRNWKNKAYDGCHEKIVMEYEGGQCRFGMDEQFTVESITMVFKDLIPHWHIIPSLRIGRRLDNAVGFQTVLVSPLMILEE
jgi:hypothetical protein